MMGPAAIDALTKDQPALFNHQLEILALYLKTDLRSGGKAFLGSLEANRLLQAHICLRNVEQGEFYTYGIELSFPPAEA